MLKRILVIIMVLVLSFAVAGCSSSGSGNGSDEKAGLTGALDDLAGNINNFIKGNVTGELNKTYSTQWFDFTIKTIKTAYDYNGYSANEGYKFVVVDVTEKNTFDEPIPMSVDDFEMHAVGLEEIDQWPLDPFEDEPGRMMPWEFDLAVGETVNYDVVFVIPEDIYDVEFIYIEIDEYDQIGATFTIKHSL